MCHSRGQEKCKRENDCKKIMILLLQYFYYDRCIFISLFFYFPQIVAHSKNMCSNMRSHHRIHLGSGQLVQTGPIQVKLLSKWCPFKYRKLGNRTNNK
jgi:hypothetical protein